jgi:Lon protease-like protein
MSRLELPNEAPVMVLPNAVLLPNALLPLRIFEPQYRAMLEWCLEHERLFCIAMLQPGADDATALNFLPVGGIGLVRACVGAEEGTSNLVLQGLARVRFASLVQTEPFRIAEISELPSDCPNLVEAEALAAKVVELCGRIHEEGSEMPLAVIEKLRHVADPEVLADIVTQTFVREPEQQQRLLEEPSVSRRLRMLIRYLQAAAPM